jgi:hypothetical protein
MRASRAGASAQREYDRRRAADDDKVRARWGRFGGLAVRLSDERQSTKAWSVGAEGERQVGRALDAIAGEGLEVLHDRRIPRSRANIDHLVVTTRGVLVIDAKRYRGRPALRSEGGLFRPLTRSLTVGGRDQSKLVAGVQRQVDVVRGVLDDGGAGDVPVRGALCFVGADWPMFGGSFQVAGVRVLWPRLLAKHLRDPRRDLTGSRVGDDRGSVVDVAAVTALLKARLHQA